MENKLVSISTDAISNIEILHQATKGIHHLHEKRIIHRDLKPQNILLVRLNALEIRVKIADFGISRAIPDERTSVTLTTTGMAAIGWRSPEILNFESGTPTAIKRLSTATDIFSLGCIFYYILTNGMHPFGQNPVDQEFNIKNYCNISTDHLPPLLIGNKWLIDNMIVRDPKARPNVKTIISHYIFWKSDKTLEFMAHISDVLFDYKQDEKIIQLGNDIESYYDVVAPNCHPRFGNPDGWLQMTCPIVRQYLCENRERTYHGRTLYQLIRTIRNLKGHHGSLAAKWLQVQYTLGSLPCGFVNYWMSRFPFLLPTLWHLCQSLLQASNDAYDVKRFYTCE
ncbi:unnamed protein product [Orchesella dallaii]|uniref:Uncharacterized protein n=1 Tax=Orchesella dallaii TaxID=48710 RepID=A0ABP1PHZ0_9HEXA